MFSRISRLIRLHDAIPTQEPLGFLARPWTNCPICQEDLIAAKGRREQAAYVRHHGKRCSRRRWRAIAIHVSKNKSIPDKEICRARSCIRASVGDVNLVRNRMDSRGSAAPGDSVPGMVGP